MRSFLSRCSLILPLVCALSTVASPDIITVRSDKNNHCISKHVIAKGHDVTVASCKDAASLKIHFVPTSDKRVVNGTFKSVDHNLYIGLKGKDQEAPLVWLPYEYKWQVLREDDGKYLIGDNEHHLYWFDYFANRASGSVELVAPNVYTPIQTLVWDIKHWTDGHRLP